MRFIPLTTVATMDEGELVTYTHGKVSKMEARVAGNKNDGSNDAYSFQKITLTDGQVSVMVKVWDRDPLPQSWIGHELHIYSQQGGNNRLGGLKIKKETYRGKTSAYVNCTPSAGMDFTAPAGASEDAAPQQPSLPQPPTQPASNLPQPPARTNQAPQPPARQNTPAPSAPAAPQKWQPLGPTVGMAVNNACSSLIASGEPLTPTRIHEVASDILRAVKWLEDGKFAPKYEDRMKKAKPEGQSEQEAGQ